jgi:hypothetical protein
MVWAAEDRRGGQPIGTFLLQTGRDDMRTASGWPVSVTIVDADLTVRLELRDEGAGAGLEPRR